MLSHPHLSWLLFVKLVCSKIEILFLIFGLYNFRRGIVAVSFV